MVRHGCASHSEAATADYCLSRLQYRRLRWLKFVPPIARVQQSTPRANAAFPCWSCKMAGPFSSIMQTADQLAQDGQSSAEQKVFGESPPWPRYMVDCLDSTISSPTRSLNGKTIRASHGSQSVSCSIRPTESKGLRGFNVRRYGIEMQLRFDCPQLPNRARLSSTARVIFRFFRNYCVEN